MVTYIGHEIGCSGIMYGVTGTRVTCLACDRELTSLASTPPAVHMGSADRNDGDRVRAQALPTA